MTSQFRPGQLVMPLDWAGTTDDNEIELTNLPGGAYVGKDLVSAGRLKIGGVALVVAVKGLDGCDVCVIGSTGGGWTQGALLEVVKQPEE